MISKEKLKKYRKTRGLTQEGLADLSGISLRTIQRIEKGFSDGSPYTLKSLAKALNIENADLLIDESYKSNVLTINKLKLINLASLFVLFIPLSNIIIPGIIFLKHKKNAEINNKGSIILSFQILWTLATIFLMFLIPILVYPFFDAIRGAKVPLYIPVYFISAFGNVFITIQTAIKLNQNSTILTFVPKIL